jgi:hypothetical protein
MKFLTLFLAIVLCSALPILAQDVEFDNSSSSIADETQIKIDTKDSKNIDVENSKSKHKLLPKVALILAFIVLLILFVRNLDSLFNANNSSESTKKYPLKNELDIEKRNRQKVEKENIILKEQNLELREQIKKLKKCEEVFEQKEDIEEEENLYDMEQKNENKYSFYLSLPNDRGYFADNRREEGNIKCYFTKDNMVVEYEMVIENYGRLEKIPNLYIEPFFEISGPQNGTLTPRTKGELELTQNGWKLKNGKKAKLEYI